MSSDTDVTSWPPSTKRKAEDQHDGPLKRHKLQPEGSEEQLLTAVKPLQTNLKLLDGLPEVDSFGVGLLNVAVEGILAGHTQKILKSLETSIETPTEWPVGTSGEPCLFSEAAWGLTMNVQPTESNKSRT
jgi:hypothetical protein